MNEFIISLGYCGDADCALNINDKSYGVESRAWNMVSLLYIHPRMTEFALSKRGQQLLKYIYDNFNEDIL